MKLVHALAMMSLLYGTSPIFAQSAPSPDVIAAETKLCSAGNGSLLLGKVTAIDGFRKAKLKLHDVWLSHTHVTIAGASDGKPYDIAIDNIFATDYEKNKLASPASLAAIQIGDTLELCGKLYPDGTGIHYVHTNCEKAPKANQANGWVKVIKADGSLGPNLEASEAFCSVFGN